MIKNPKTYLELTNLAANVAGNADQEWNLRFRRVLQATSLALTCTQPEKNEDLYPEGFACFAPRSFSNLDDWPTNTWIVWR